MKNINHYLCWPWSTLLVVVMISSIACTSTPQLPSKPVAVHLALPGQQIWQHDVSSYLFGTNDTYEWSANNIQTQPKIQQALRDAGFTLIRTFFPDEASDSVISQRVQTIENSKAQCLGVITNIYHTSFDEHLVRYLGSRCVLYEFGNEPDWNNISIQGYLQQWNMLIPLLRKINPAAKFIGPATYNPLGKNNFMQNFLQGVKASGVLPDAVSFHWYPCWQDSEASCLSKTSSAGTSAIEVEAQVQAILGKALPVGITEWNYDPGNPPPSYGDDATFMTKFTTEALASMIQGGVSFACQFDAASYSGYGHLDMINVTNNQPKPQYYAIKSVIQHYRPSTTSSQPKADATP